MTRRSVLTGQGASNTFGLAAIIERDNAAPPRIRTPIRAKPAASRHSRCQSAINGSNTLDTVEGSNQRATNANARVPGTITPRLR